MTAPANPAPLRHNTHTPQWSAYATSDCAEERLAAIEADLMPYRSDPVVLARIGHLRMLRKDPGSAVRLLTGQAHPLARAQLLLARLHEAMYLLSGDAQTRVYVDVSLTPPYFEPPAHDPLHLEAQMRLDYALGLAFLEQGSSRAHDFFARSDHLGRLLGIPAMPLATATAKVKRDVQRSPLQRAQQLVDAAVSAYKLGNERLLTHNAQEAVELLMDANLYDRIIPVVCDRLPWLPQAELWRSAVRSLRPEYPLNERLGEVPLDHWSIDPLILMSHAYQHVVHATRAIGRLDLDSAVKHAGRALALPAWPAPGGRRVPEAVFRGLQVLALLYSGDRAGATAALRDAIDDRLHLTGDAARWYLGLVCVNLVAGGAAAPQNWSIHDAADAAYTAMSRLEHEYTVLLGGRAASVAPSAVWVLAHLPGMPSGLSHVASEIVLLGDTAVRNHKKLPGAPRDMKGEPCDIVERGAATHDYQVLHRYRRALLQAGEPPVAFDWCIERVLIELEGYAPLGKGVK